MEKLLPKSRVRARPARRPFHPGVVRGVFTGVDATGAALVRFADSPGRRARPAACACRLTRADVGRPVLLSFEGGDLRHPVILGLLQPVRVVEAHVRADGGMVDAVLDDQRLVLSAAAEVVLRCGDASITLTRSGQVRIQGNYVVSRARTTNRIKGGSVQIN